MASKRKTSLDVVRRLTRVIRWLSSDSDPERLLSEAVRLSRVVAGADGVSLMLADGEGTELVEHQVQGRKLNPTATRVRVGAGDRNIASRAAACRKTILVPHVRNEGQEEGTPGGRAKSVAALPVLEGERLVGVIVFGSKKRNFFGREDVPLLEYLASQMALGIHLCRVHGQVGSIRSRLELLHHLARLGNGSLPPEAFLSCIVEELRRAFEVRDAGVYVGDAERGEIALVARSNSEPSETFEIGSRQKLEDGLIGTIFKLGETVYVKDVSKDPITAGKSVGVSSELCVPISVGAHCLGVLDLQSETVDNFTKDDVVVVETIGHTLAATLHRLSKPVPAS
ncbi:MAG: GAF domain-containing protein [Planctomycetes bacterium]|nr:GAF domain-containing protein [Planctomycetota bacterium]